MRVAPEAHRLSPVVRVLVVAVVRLGLLFYAGWFAFHEAPLGGEGIPIVGRIGLVLLFLVFSILLGEIDRLRTHFGLLIGALRAAGGAGGAAAEAAAAAGVAEGAGEAPSDPRASVDILIQAIDADDPETVEKVHQHLVRLTGKNLPAEAALWQRWWQENRESWGGPPTGTTGNDG